MTERKERKGGRKRKSIEGKKEKKREGLTERDGEKKKRRGKGKY